MTWCSCPICTWIMWAGIRRSATDSAFRSSPTRYVVHEEDLTHIRKPELQAAGRFPYIDRPVDPLDELGVLDTLSGDSDLTPEVRALHTPGHTRGT